MSASKNELHTPTLESAKAPQLRIPKEYICGGISTVITVAIVFPLHKTVFFQQLDGISWTDSVRRLQKEGVRHLYRGLLPPLLQRGTTVSIMFGFQSQAQQCLSDNPQTSELPGHLKITLSAILAGCVEATLTPFERVQTLLQSSKYSHVYKNAPHALSTIYKYHGLRELYRGFTPIIIRNCIGDVLYFRGKAWLGDKSHSEELPLGQRLASNFIIGGLLGSTIGSILTPLNVSKAQLQSSVGTEFTSLRFVLRSLLNERKSAKITRLYSGLPANFSRSMVSWGIITMIYEWLIHL